MLDLASGTAAVSTEFVVVLTLITSELNIVATSLSAGVFRCIGAADTGPGLLSHTVGGATIATD